ncbi:probable transmembrane ascorbate ferrireductase 4 [Typha latifolia]|uniref:probable transmembrane ascorbate ferrireductase 4 n=1 Tax=Typha latifolia TaxID=4733 RepID=UPI003C2E72E6
MAGVIVSLARLASLLVAVLVLVWSLAFRSTVLLSTSAAAAAATTHFDHLYSVLHHILMVVGFILLGGEALLAQRRKSARLFLQGAALLFGLFGIWAKFKGKNGIVANFYSLHSWIGLLSVSLFGAQWLSGFLSLLTRSEGRRSKSIVRPQPWRVFAGLYTYSLAVATAEMGLLEKMTVLQTKRGLPRRSIEATLVNGLGLVLALLCGLVVLAAVTPRHQRNAKNNHRALICPVDHDHLDE